MSSPASNPIITPEPGVTAQDITTVVIPASQPTQGEWRLGQTMLAPPRSELPAVTLDDWIYVPGGFGGENRLDRYDPVADLWQTLTDMPAGRHHLMATAYADYLYILGGAEAGSWTPTNTFWRYDPAINTWNEVGMMPESRLAGSAVNLGDKIYLVGGAGGSEDLLEFSFASGQWRSLPGPAQPREHVSAVAFQGELWVLGGRWGGVGELSTVEIYNPATETWRDGPSLTVARAGFAAAVVQQHIMVAGGEVIINSRKTLASFETLAFASDTWQDGPDLLYPMHGVGGAEFQGQFLLLGGSRQAGAIENEGQVQIYDNPH
jgi:N-acetylneuraminic acid mutarotase